MIELWRGWMAGSSLLAGNRRWRQHGLWLLLDLFLVFLGGGPSFLDRLRRDKLNLVTHWSF
jgi:hypothetical protein